uniref:FAS1 domain-containing protein n=1 Tax=Oryza punctata TaxID=4537 RepID=A0A0E0KJY3_ORYPU
MGAPVRGALVFFFLLLAGAAAETAPEEPTLPSTAADGGGDGASSGTASGAGAGTGTTAGAGINSNSVLVALLDSHYTELAELVEKALLLQTLEDAVGKHNVTIFAPRNEALERDLDPEFKRFLLEPRNLKSLQSLLLFHVLPARLPSGSWSAVSHPTLSGEEVELAAAANDGAMRVAHAASLLLFHVLPARLPSGSWSAVSHPTLSGEEVELAAAANDGAMRVAHAAVTRPDAVLRPDGVIHGIERLLVPRSVQEDFNRRRSLADISAVLPTGAPEVDPRTHRLKKPAPPVPPGAPPVLPIWDAMAPGPSIAPAPAPGPGSGKHHFDGHSQVKDFIQTLLLYGGYNELADILVNLTSLATEMGRLVSEGYVLTVLAPNDEAMARLTTDQLSEPGSPENILYYHMIPEYQTEESMYNAVRRFGKVRYDTLRLPHKVVAREADGSVKFGHGEGSAYLFDPDIYTDGRIAVQGIDAVLFPPDDTKMTPDTAPVRRAPAVTGTRKKNKLRRGKLLEATCQMAGILGQRSRFASCQ